MASLCQTLLVAALCLALTLRLSEGQFPIGMGIGMRPGLGMGFGMGLGMGMGLGGFGPQYSGFYDDDDDNGFDNDDDYGKLSFLFLTSLERKQKCIGRCVIFVSSQKVLVLKTLSLKTFKRRILSNRLPNSSFFF